MFSAGLAWTDLFGEDVGVDEFDDLLVGARQVGTCLLDEPLLAGDALVALAVHALFARAQLDGLVGEDDGGANRLLHRLAFDYTSASLPYAQENREGRSLRSQRWNYSNNT